MPSAYLGLGTLRVEIIEFHSTFSHHGNTQASLTLLIWLNEKVQKLGLKINQKLMLVRRSAHFLFWSALRAEIFQNQIKIFQKSWAVRLKAYSFFSALTGGNY